jgi:N-acetylglucosamine-6-sulfatase
VLIVTDDQRLDTMFAMPRVRRLLFTHGVAFAHAYAASGECCPSRASLLTGLYPHHSGVWSNHEPYAFSAFDDRSTVATWLDAAGYRTALIGKYMNGYDPSSKYVPPGWDRWFGIPGGYWRYEALDKPDGGVPTVVGFGSDLGDYSTHVLTRNAQDFVSSTPDGTPFFLYLSYFAPHGPAKPLPGDADAFADLPPWHPASFNERDVTDKPWFVQHRPLLDKRERQAIQRFRRAQLATLLAVDRSIAKLIHTLRETSRLHNTVVIFTSDQGVMWGEHRRTAKAVPYEEVVHVPLGVRWDRRIAGGWSTPNVSANVDIAATIAAAAGVPRSGVDGRSLLPMLTDRTKRWPRRVVIAEQRASANGFPTFCQVRYRRFVFMTYYNGDRSKEFYDLHRDPLELENAVHDGRYASVIHHMRRMRETHCGQPPP